MKIFSHDVSFNILVFFFSLSFSLVFHIFVVVFARLHCVSAAAFYFFSAFHETKLLSQVLNSFSADLCARVPHTRWVGLSGERKSGEGVTGGHI